MNLNIFKKAPALNIVKFDGKTPYNVVVRDAHVYDTGEYVVGDNANEFPFIRILAEEATTRTPLHWNIKFWGIAPRYYTDPKTGAKTQGDSERLSACKALSRGLGVDFTNDIEKLYQLLDGACLRVIAEEVVVRDEEGEPVRNDDGTVRVWHKVKILRPEDGAPSREPSLAQRINSDNVAKAEAKRANKGKRGYPGNTGEA